MSENELVPPLSGFTTIRTGDPGQPVFRDQLDARRSMWMRTPNAEIPDGYLGGVPSRRDDRMFQTLKYKLYSRSYDRGVHKGTRIDPHDYEWASDYNPMTNIKKQMQGRQPGQLAPSIAQVETGRAPFLRGVGVMPQVDTVNQQQGVRRAQQLARFRPPWSP